MLILLPKLEENKMDNRNSIERLKSIQLSLSELSNSLEETYFKNEAGM